MLKPVLNSSKYFLMIGLISISAGCNQLRSTDDKTVEEFMTEYFTAIKSSKSDLNFTCDGSLLPEFYSLSNFKILKAEWDEKKGGEANVRITANNISTNLPITHTFVFHLQKGKNRIAEVTNSGLCINSWKENRD